MESKLYIVTVATEIKYYMKYLIESVKKFNGELIILGLGEKWKGFNWKFKLTVDFLKKINPMDIVCFVDGYDVVCTRNLLELPNILKQIYQKEKFKIIVGHDRVVNSLALIFQFLYFGKCKNDFINSGTYIGYSKDLLDIFNIIHNNSFGSKENLDDQILLTNYCNLYPSDIYIDIDNEIFLVLSHSFEELKDKINFNSSNEIIYNNTSKPFFVHGPASTYLDFIIKGIGYNHNDNNTIKEEIYNDFWNKKIYILIPHFFNEKIDLIMIILFFILIVILVLKSYKK